MYHMQNNERDKYSKFSRSVFSIGLDVVLSDHIISPKCAIFIWFIILHVVHMLTWMYVWYVIRMKCELHDLYRIPSKAEHECRT